MRTKVPEGLGGRRGLVCPEPPVLVLSILHPGSAEGLGCINATHPWQAPTTGQLGGLVPCWKSRGYPCP